MRKFLVLIFSVMFLNSSTMAATDPIQMLQSIANQMIAGLKAHKTSLKTNPALVYSLATKIIVPHADLGEMSKRVLPPSVWESAAPTQRAQFKAQFTTLLVRTYASALADYKDQTVRFYPIRGGVDGKTNLKVDSAIIRSDGPSISVSYRLILEGSQWKLYDMIVEGVSLIESFRSQFADKLSQGGTIMSLVQDLKQHNSENGG